jgi:hypothetical protein
LQLTRWEFPVNTGERSKFVHEFQFPVEFHVNGCDSDHNLTGVILHQRTADQGHDAIIVQGDDKE